MSLFCELEVSFLVENLAVVSLLSKIKHVCLTSCWVDRFWLFLDKWSNLQCYI